MKRIDIKPYNGILYYTTSREEFLKKRKDFKDELIYDIEDCDGMASDDKNNVHLVGVFDGSITTLVHELSHVTIKVLEHVGVPITSECSEAYCYLISNLMEELIGYQEIIE